MAGAISAPIAAHFAQKRAWKYTKAMMKNKYQWQVADLRAAGLNPILGYANPPPIGSVPAPVASGGGGDLVATAKQVAKFKPEVTMAKHQAKLVGNAADKEHWLANRAMYDASSAKSAAFLRASLLPRAVTDKAFDTSGYGQWVRRLTRSLDPLRGIFGAGISKRLE